MSAYDDMLSNNQVRTKHVLPVWTVRVPLAGEIMGCGILFPREYRAEADMCENLSLVATEDERDYPNSESEEEDGDEWAEQEGGTKVQVFIHFEVC